MRIVSYYNEKNIFMRLVVTVAITLIIIILWYFIMFTKVNKEQTFLRAEITHAQNEMSNLTQLISQQKRLVYKGDIAGGSAREILSDALESVNGITMTGFNNEGMEMISLLNPGKNILASEFGIHVTDQLNVHEFVATFSGDFLGLLMYLKKIQEGDKPVFFEAIDYNVRVPPAAKVTIRAFTLEE